jgi:hypothetical protein
VQEYTGYAKGAGSYRGVSWGSALDARRVDAFGMTLFAGDIANWYFLPSDEPSVAAKTAFDVVAHRPPAATASAPARCWSPAR